MSKSIDDVQQADDFSFSMRIQQIEEENRVLKHTLAQMKRELEHFLSPPFLVCEIKEVIGKEAIVHLPNGNEFYVKISEKCPAIQSGDTVLAEQKNLTVLSKVNRSKSFNVEKFVIIEKPTLTWDDIGGLKDQIREIQEVIELPLKKPQLFEKIGITPPKGILLYGPPGTGKTILAKAVAASTNSTFIEVVGSELVQKFIGEGAKMVKEIFELAREKAPSIIFIDELDALAANRIDVGTSGEREVQRTFMQFLAEIDGFKPLSNVKIIGCTNRRDILDTAVLRPGRLDRQIKVDLPDEEGILQIFRIHSKSMRLDKSVNLELLVKKMEKFSGAEIKATCTEAGYFAIREDKTSVSQRHFFLAIEKVRKQELLEGKDYLGMFG